MLLKTSETETYGKALAQLTEPSSQDCSGVKYTESKSRAHSCVQKCLCAHTRDKPKRLQNKHISRALSFHGCNCLGVTKLSNIGIVQVWVACCLVRNFKWATRMDHLPLPFWKKVRTGNFKTAKPPDKRVRFTTISALHQRHFPHC